MELARRLLEALTGYEADDHNQARLLNRPDCRKPVTPRDAEKLWLRSLELPVPEHIWASNGCDKCHRIRYFGRIGIFELWRLGEEDYRLILEHADEHRLRRHFHERLHGGLIQDGLAKVVAGATSLSELRRAGSGAFPTETSV